MTEQLREQCRQVARRVLERRGWQLVQDEAAFVDAVQAQVQLRLNRMQPGRENRRPMDKVIEDATVNCYGYVWHAACAANGTLRQWQAFGELQRYLYPIALYCAHHDYYVAEEGTQEALISVWQHLDQVRDLGSFARWAGAIVSNQVKKKLGERRRRNGEITQADLPSPQVVEAQGHGESRNVEAELQHIHSRSTPLVEAPKLGIADEIRARVEAAIRRCLRRSKQQQAVIISHFLKTKGLKEVADEMDRKPESIYVLKTRALASLRECKDLLEVLEELA
jgi:RNA polymerase sigma factor (sigma-70 family)